VVSVRLDSHVSSDLSVKENEGTVLRRVVLVISIDFLTLLLDESVEL